MCVLFCVYTMIAYQYPDREFFFSSPMLLYVIEMLSMIARVVGINSSRTTSSVHGQSKAEEWGNDGNRENIRTTAFNSQALLKQIADVTRRVNCASLVLVMMRNLCAGSLQTYAREGKYCDSYLYI
jgi:hypothetical protein